MSDRFIQLSAVAVAAASIAGAAALAPGLDRERRECKMAYEPAGTGQKDAVFRVIENLGALRGIAVNVLWNRLNDLKSEGRYYEADALGRRICELQPRIPEVWRHLAYNMAYNISVKCQTQEERWSWIEKGLRLLKEEGIPNNPEAEPLYREVAWTYQHKIASASDDMNRFYKKRVAQHWQLLLGVPPLGRHPKAGGAPGETEEAALAQMRQIADAAQSAYGLPDGRTASALPPAARADFLAKHPDTAHALAQIEKACREFGVDYPGLSPALAMAAGRVLAFGEYSQFAADAGLAEVTQALQNKLGADGRAVVKAIQGDARAQKGLGEAMPLLRAIALIEQERMDPRVMQGVMEKYGPLDWRHPQSHALYWASLGARHGVNPDSVTKINTDRIIVAATQGLMDGGRVFYDPLEDSLSDQPDPRFIEPYAEAQAFMLDRASRHEYEMWRSTADSLARGEENFLHRAIQVSFLFGEEAQAQMYYRRVKEKFPKSAVYAQYYNLNLADFVVVTIRQDTLRVVQEAAMTGLVNRGLEAMLLGHNPGRAQMLFKMAEETRKGIEVEHKDRAKGVQGSDDAARPVPTQEQMMGQAMRRFVTEPSHTLRQRAAAYQQLPNDLRLALFDDIEKTVYPQVRQSGLPVAPEAYFPPPEHLAEYRKARAGQEIKGGTVMPDRQ